jgi:hypothetical protein
VTLAETNGLKAPHETLHLVEKSIATDYVAHGAGVIATFQGYKQAENIEAYLPIPYSLGILPREVVLYRRLQQNSPAAIDARNKQAYQLRIWDSACPNIVRGEE